MVSFRTSADRDNSTATLHPSHTRRVQDVDFRRASQWRKVPPLIGICDPASAAPAPQTYLQPRYSLLLSSCD
jgi:hypothetical protein